jgi:ubiquinone biosynthesis protein COQ9
MSIQAIYGDPRGESLHFRHYAKRLAINATLIG